MTAKDYLKDALTIDRELETKKHMLEKLCGSGITELSQRVKAEYDALMKKKCEYMDIIGMVNNATSRQILERRYICCDTWEVIAEQMHYDVSWIHRLHGYALKDVDAILKENNISK